MKEKKRLVGNAEKGNEIQIKEMGQHILLSSSVFFLCTPESSSLP